MDASELDYELPSSAISQVPAEPRDSARLLVDTGATSPPRHLRVADLPDLVGPGDVVVVNDTRVIPARLHLSKPTGGAVEVLLLERRADGWWEALVRPSRRVAPGTRLTLARPPRPGLRRGSGGAPGGPGSGEDLVVEVGEVLGVDGRRRVVLHGGAGDDDLAVLDGAGEVPLPPYIHEPLADADRYQTVYADHPGSVAAPTAGLHLTRPVLDRCLAAGAAVARVDLAVGLGTFRPMTTERVEDHPMHAERYRIPPETVALLAHRGREPAFGPRHAVPGADERRARVLAVGTTVVRALESWSATGVTEGSTSLFIHGDHRFAMVDRLLTNFHVPRSSLLAMVEAFVGPHWRDLYAEALAEGYRFLSFGDAMLLDGAST